MSDANFYDVALLLHADGADLSTSFTDSVPGQMVLAPSGTINISTATSRFGGSSIYISDLNGSYSFRVNRPTFVGSQLFSGGPP